jgi:hypothetical protein
MELGQLVSTQQVLFRNGRIYDACDYVSGVRRRTIAVYPHR